jgi:uncharacterized protein (TIGR03437 family)
MKFIPFFFFAAAALAADFTTGQAARAVIGQETFTAQSDTPTDATLGGASGIAYAADTLFVADSNRVSAAPINHRVLLFQNISGQLPKPTDQLGFARKCPVCVGDASLVLGQPDFITNTQPASATQNNLRLPTAVASDGVHLVVADTDHNRVLIWNSIPSSNNQNADVVVGQANFTSTTVPGNTPNAKSMRGPQGVWIQNGKLYVADTQNHRVLIYNHIPSSNGAAADVVLGQKDFTTFVEPDLVAQKTDATASNLLNPVSVSSDGVHLFVADLGYNRVLIWNGIPTNNATPADVVVGQPDMSSSLSNNSFTVDSSGNKSKVLCDSTGNDADGKPIFPTECNSTISFPRFALSDGTRLYIADGGNDRVLIFSQIPSQNGQAADKVIGQLGGDINQASDAADSLRTPMSLAWDGTNLYVSDAYNRRITVYSIGENTVPYTGVRNAASLEIFATGAVALAGSITANDTVTINIDNPTRDPSGCVAPGTSTTTTSSSTTTTTCGKDYPYKIQTNDGFNDVVTGLVNAINAGSGDPDVLATPDFITETVLLTARQPGTDAENIQYSARVSTSATITATALGSALTGGGDAAKVGPGTLVSIMGQNLSENTASADTTQDTLPTTLGNTQVYFNGIRAPLTYVSPTQINAQIPWEVDTPSSINAYVRSEHSDGSVLVTTPVAVTVVTQNPGIFAQAGFTQDPRPGVILHSSSNATGVILVDGAVNAGDVATVMVEDRSYTYTVQSSDTLESIRDQLVAVINQDPKVTAVAGISFARNIQLRARISGPDGNGITFSSSTTNSSGSPQLVLTPTNTALCCANVAGTSVTDDNPAIPGETLILYATGLGVPQSSDQLQGLIVTGQKYPQGAPVTQPINFVSSLAGGKTANILSASLKPGTVGIFEVLFQLNADMITDPLTTMYIAQDIFVSNLITFPLVNPAQ